MGILRRKDVHWTEAIALLHDADEYGPAAWWLGSGCAAAGIQWGTPVSAYYLQPLASHFGAQDVTCHGDDPEATAAALEASGEAPAPDMGDHWVIATFPHGEWQCRQWPFPHVHNLILMGTQAEILRAFREHQDAMSRTW